MMNYVFITLCPILIFGGYPISDPFNDLGANGKILPYNLIDTNPSCFWNDNCPMFPPGGELSAFPNSEEKFQHILHNMHRMFANQSLDTSLGYYLYGANTIKRSYFCLACSSCGSTSTTRVPLYWYSDANQMARFKQWDEKTCNQSWYSPPNDAHMTCKWGQEVSTSFEGTQYTTPSDRCSMFSNDCGFGARGSGFCRDIISDRCWFETEGICGGNSCLKDSHCEPIFANKYDYVGKGFVEGMNGVAAVYSRYTKEIWYLLPIGAHFDERLRIAPDDWNSDNKHFVLMLQYHDANESQTPVACYALYDDEITNMPVYLSYMAYGGNRYHPTPDFYSRDSHSVIFKAHFLPPTSCRPYSFMCRTTNNVLFRLPQDADYYFGTEWIDWSWSNYSANGLYCKENHYYDHDTEGWTVNGGPTLTQSDIWYYKDTVNYGSCIGCQYISVLDCLSQCIYDNDLSTQCQFDCNGKTAAPTQAPVPTPEPTRTPTSIPSDQPSSSPTSVTAGPTAIPTKQPTAMPTQQPTFNTFSPSKKPTKSPVEPTFPTLVPSETPSKVPTTVTSSPTEVKTTPTKRTRSRPPTRARVDFMNPDAFGWEEYVVFGIIGLLIILCCVGMGCVVKRCKNSKKKTAAQKVTPIVFPGAKHVQIPSHGKDSMEGSTDRNNKYKSRFIKQRKSTDEAPNRANMEMGLTVPPAMRLLGHGHHAAVPSVSIPSGFAPQLTPPPPPPSTQNMSADKEVEELNDKDITNAFDLDI